MEIWKDIKGYNGIYQVSNFGNVRTTNYHGKCKTHLLKERLNYYGYYTVLLFDDSKDKFISKFVHRLVAESFIDNPKLLPCVNHKDENKTNNYVDNLEWCDIAYNNNYGTRIERMREKMKGRVFTDEHKKNISLAKKSKHLHHTDDWCKEHSKRMKGENNPIFGIKRKRIYNSDGTYKYIVVDQ